ncbi:ribonuclease PH [bacterium]|nr:ribonuclease PH [bacterium]
MPEFTNLKDLDSIVLRAGGRAPDELRGVTITPDYIPSAAGSVLIECGATRVICVVSIEDKVPKWMQQQNGDAATTGWLTAEYNLMPYAGSGDRKMRESTAGRLSGRTQEIQRLIGRAFRTVIDLDAIGQRTIWIDCDVVEADGGTRTASVTGAYVALVMAVNRLVKRRVLRKSPVNGQVSAVSVGMVKGRAMLDLDYREDSTAETDMNVVMTADGAFVEVQGTAEGKAFSRAHLDAMLALAEKGCRELHAKQLDALAAFAIR